jgi:PAS domain-containing protein
MHPLLSRQVKRFFEQGTDQLDPSLRAFIAAIDSTYQDADSDRSTLERSLDLSSHELLKANSEMRAILQSFPDLFFRLDRNGRILDC